MDKNWIEKAACKGVPVEVFYDDNGGTYNRAMRICWGDRKHGPCPVRLECLNWACTFSEEEDRYGVFGGLNARQRRSYRRNNEKQFSKPKPLKAPAPKQPNKRPKYWNGKRCFLTGFEHEGLT